MAFFTGDIRSSVLEMDTGLTVILPHDKVEGDQQNEPCKVLFLLHGYGSNSSSWARSTSIDTYVRKKNIAVIMPEVQTSLYADMTYGLPYFTYITEELPAICARMFGTSTRREDTFVAGNSLGGYGAMKCALTHPERYGACASFSGALDFRGMAEYQMTHYSAHIPRYVAVFGNDLELPDEADLHILARDVISRSPEERPRLFFTCGQEDFLYRQSIHFDKFLGSIGYDHLFMQWPGDHDWEFWDASVKRAVDFFLGDD